MNAVQGFAAVPNWMVRDAGVSVNELAVFASLASRSGLGGIFVGQATIAEELGLSERTVRAVVSKLENRFVIQRVRRFDKKGHRLSDGYALTPESLPARFAAGDSLPATEDAPTGKTAQTTPLIEVEPLEVDTPVVPRGDGLEEKLNALWELWPSSRRSTRKVVEKHLRAALKSHVNWQSIIGGAVQHTSVWRTWPAADIQFVPLLSTWLSQERWTGAPPLPRGGGRLGTLDQGRRADALLAEYDRRAVSA